MGFVTKRVAVAPFELKLGPNESYGRAASVGSPPGAKTAQIQAKIIVKLPIHRPGGCYVRLMILANERVEKAGSEQQFLPALRGSWGCLGFRG